MRRESGREDGRSGRERDGGAITGDANVAEQGEHVGARQVLRARTWRAETDAHK